MLRPGSHTDGCMPTRGVKSWRVRARALSESNPASMRGWSASMPGPSMRWTAAAILEATARLSTLGAAGLTTAGAGSSAASSAVGAVACGAAGLSEGCCCSSCCSWSTCASSSSRAMKRASPATVGKSKVTVAGRSKLNALLSVVRSSTAPADRGGRVTRVNGPMLLLRAHRSNKGTLDSPNESRPASASGCSGSTPGPSILTTTCSTWRCTAAGSMLGRWRTAGEAAAGAASRAEGAVGCAVPAAGGPASARLSTAADTSLAWKPAS